MLFYLFAGMGAVKMVNKVVPIADFIKLDDREVLNKGLNQPKQMVLVDDVAEKYLSVSLTKTQKVAHKKFLVLVRKVVNTKLFETVTAKMLHDKWPGKTSMGYQVKLS